MKLEEPDLDDNYSVTSTQRIDKSIGYVVIGLIVILFFGIIVAGMNRLQTVSDHTIKGLPRDVGEPAAEIGDTTPPKD